MYHDLSTKCRTFHPPLLKTEGGQAFVVAKMRFFREIIVYKKKGLIGSKGFNVKQLNRGL